jgi:hypothetical protein
MVDLAQRYPMLSQRDNVHATAIETYKEHPQGCCLALPRRSKCHSEHTFAAALRPDWMQCSNCGEQNYN